MDYTNKALGLRVQTQIPLNVKEYSESEESLKDLGLNNNLAFTYEKGLIVYCVLEGTRYEWKEILLGETGTLLLDNNFIYPNNIIVFGIDYSNKEYNFVKITNDIPIIDGSETKIIDGANTTVVGNGTIDSPYQINTPTPSGSETKLINGINTVITGSGTIGLPYQVNVTFPTPPDGSETKINSTVTTSVTGNGTTLTPYSIEVKNLQKSITNNYTLLASDNNYSIKVNNDTTPINITIPSGLPENFFVGITQKGTGDITFVASGTTLSNPIGLKLKGFGYFVGIEQIGSTNSFDILGNTKV